MINKYLDFLITIFLIFIAYQMLIWTIRKITKKQKFPADAIQGIKLIIKMVAILLFIISLLIVIDIPDEFLISISSVGGIIIGFASTEIMSQVFSGIYLISTRLFGVDDFIQIGTIEGMVLEIGVNYTVIQKIDGSLVKIPNKRILDSKIKNYTILMADKIKKQNVKEKELKHMNILKKQEKGILKSFFSKTRNYSLKKLFDDYSNFMFEKAITSYTFNFELLFDIKPEIVCSKLDELCEKYEKIFNYTPIFKISDFGFRITIKFIIRCIDPHQILENHKKIMKDIAFSFYKEVEI